jgi:Ser/Thr protein kinase RdoA (MazF antagonist)
MQDIWDFFREGSNHAYIQNGTISYKGDCNNNLIVSYNNKNVLTDIKNAFILARGSNVKTVPIFDLDNVIDKIRGLSLPKIRYNIPAGVLGRENLPMRNLEEIADQVKQRYGINSENVSIISSGRSKKGGVYYVKGTGGHKYIMKYLSENKEQAELSCAALANSPIYFPKIYPRKDDVGYTFEMKDGVYNLQEYIEDDSPKRRNLGYFKLLGRHMALLHKQLSDFTEKNECVRKVLLSKGEFINESSMASIYLDLANYQKSNFLLSKLDEVINENLSVKVRGLSKSLIHRDLNYSNIIWKENIPKIIDSESIGFSSRIGEFISPILFKGNMKKPKYVKGSLSTLTNAYNLSVGKSLSKEEMKSLPYLVQYTLLRNFVIRRIRRGVGDESYFDETRKNLKRLEENL